MLPADPVSTVPALARNEVLRALPPGDLSLLRPHLSRVRLVHGQIVHEAGERIEHAYFIEQGIVSMVSETDGAGPDAVPGMTEIGMVGREGLAGLTVLLQEDTIAYSRSMVQVPGAAFRIPAPVLRRLVAEVPLLQQALFRTLQILMSTMSQTAACNSRHTLPERLARWLLIAHDRVDGDDLPLTQEFLSIMLGVRRSGVTVATATLERAGLVRHSRGRITITDRDGLERAGCDCYARVRAFDANLPGRNGTVAHPSMSSFKLNR